MLSQTSAPRSGLDPVSEAVAQMAHQLETGMEKSNISRLPLAVLAFRNLLQPEQPGELGERLGESFVFQLEQRGYNLVDYRAQSLVTSVKPEIEPYNMSALRNRHRIYFVLTGTYAQHPDGIVINARLLDTTTRQVLASGQSHIPLERLEQRWPGYDLLDARERGMIIENRQGPAGGSE
jgi:TolB-like protein